MSESWTHCPNCGCGPGLPHQKGCPRGRMPAPKVYTEDVGRPHGGMDGKAHARNAAGGVLPVVDDEVAE